MAQLFYHDHSVIPETSLVGGKARNLAVLSHHGVQVPPWIGITTEFFEEFMGDALKILDVNLRRKSGGKKNIEKMSGVITGMIMKRRFPPALRKKTETLIRERFGPPEGRFFSIRSSAVDEDSIRFSFAGQLDSFLYVKFDRDFFTAIRKCFASAYSARVMHYRHAGDIPFAGIRPAVIVQEMVFGDVSGVVFTGNPLNNNPDQVLVNAAYGIGEGIVSGELDTDMWLVDAKGAIVRAQTVSKKEMITFDARKGKGTLKAPVAEELWDRPSVDEAMVLEIADTARKIEKLFGRVHQDIEWCLRDGTLFILQSRPVTTFSHIRRTLPRTIFDNSNIIESFSGVTSPLTFSFASTMYDAVYRQFYELMGTPREKIEELSETFRNMLAYINGRVYYNLNSWFITLQLIPGYNLNKEFMENMMGVKNPVDIQKAETVSTARKIFVELPRAIRGLSMVIFHLWTLNGKIGKFIKSFDDATGPYMDEKFEGYSNGEIIKLYNYFIRTVLRNWKAPIVNDLYTMIFFGVLSKQIRKLGIEGHENLQNDLLSGEGDMESTKPTKEIIRISNWLRSRDELVKLFAEKNERELMRIILGGDDERYREAGDRIRSYISSYGFRCMNELKLEETSLKEDPTFLFTTLKNYLKREPIDLEGQERREKEIRRKAENLVFAKIPRLKRPVFRWVLNNTRRAIKNREELRFMRTKIFGIERGMFNRMGRALAEGGIIGKQKDIYYLHINEVFELVEGRSLNSGIVSDIIRLRKKRNAEYAGMETPERMYFYGDIYDRNFLDILPDEEMDAGGDTGSPNIFKGVSCSPGEVEGVVKIVLAPQDAKLNGEILVTKRTDPGWVPLFPSVSGIIIERGSVLSHSAVVAREMGIPTIVGLRGITDRLASGDRVRMNGSTGIIEKLVKE
jgi:pyruvate,water dikinase